MMYGPGSGEYGRKAHKALRKMTLHSGALAAGQDALRAAANVTRTSGGTSNKELEHGDVTHSHANLKGSVASRLKR